MNPGQPPRPPHDMPEAHPLGSPTAGLEHGLEHEGLAGCQYRDYSSHYASHSQFYHPETQRRRHQHPDDFWYAHSHQSRLAGDHDQHQQQQPHPSSVGSVALHEEYGNRVGPGHHFSEGTRGLSRDDGCSITNVDRDYPPVQETWQEFPYRRQPATDAPQPHSDPPPPPPPPTSSSPITHTHCTAREEVSAIDLIKRSRGDKEEEMHSREERERGSEDPVAPVPPWMQHGAYPAAVVREEVGRMEGRGGKERDRERVGYEEVQEDAGRGGRVKEKGAVWEETPLVSEYESSFVAEVQKFLRRNVEMVNTLTEKNLTMEVVPTLHNLKSEESFRYGEPDALEYHMQVDENVRRRQFFKLVEVHDVVRGHVVAKRHSGLTIRITSFINSHKYRELSDLSIRGVVVFENLAGNSDSCDDVMRDMLLDDVVQAVVVRVDVQGELLMLSFREADVPEGRTESLGYKESRRPVSPRPGAVARDDFLQRLEDDPGFSNPQATPNLCQLLGLSRASLRPTLLRELQTAEYVESDYAEPLRKAQRFKWSMKTVAVGVDHFKSGSHNSAMQYFNHALDIDPSNVEGLVARGALFATSGKYKDGIADFQKALALKSTHRNARNYLVETQVVFGKELEKQGRVDSAMECYRDVLTIDPEEATAKERLGALTAAMERQAAEWREKEKAEEEEREKLLKLRKMIEKEKKKRLTKEKKPKTKKRRKGEKHKKHSKASKRHYSSSDEEDESTATGTEDEEAADGKREGRKRGESRERRRHKKRKTHSKSSRRRYSSEEEDESTASGAGGNEGDSRRRKKRDGRHNESKSSQRHYSSEEESVGVWEERERDSEDRGGDKGARKRHRKAKREHKSSQRRHHSSFSEESTASRDTRKREQEDEKWRDRDRDRSGGKRSSGHGRELASSAESSPSLSEGSQRSHRSHRSRDGGDRVDKGTSRGSKHRSQSDSSTGHMHRGD